MIVAETAPSRDWASAWPDALAFVLGLGLAWWLQWQTTDLVWSLWCSSLTVGYAMILWTIFRPTFRLVWEAKINGGTPLALAGLGGAFFLGSLFLLAFFTVHFGMFHLVHSIFLNTFFPIDPNAHGRPSIELYREVFARYWWWLPIALLAERQAFRWSEPKAAPSGAYGGAISRGKPALGSDMMAPYRNVIRMHLLIFFFAFASFAHLQGFAIYAAVYAVYFFPWRLVFPPRK